MKIALKSTKYVYKVQDKVKMPPYHKSSGTKGKSTSFCNGLLSSEQTKHNGAVIKHKSLLFIVIAKGTSYLAKLKKKSCPKSQELLDKKS